MTFPILTSLLILPLLGALLLFFIRDDEANQPLIRKTALVVSLLVGGLFAVLIAFSETRWAAICMVLSAALLSVVGTWEYIQLALAKDLRPAGRLMMGLSFALVLTFFYAQKFPQYSQLPLAIFVIGVVSFFIFHFSYVASRSLHSQFNI